MTAAGVRLVVPQPYRQTYPASLQRRIITFADFIEEVSSSRRTSPTPTDDRADPRVAPIRKGPDRTLSLFSTQEKPSIRQHREALPHRFREERRRAAEHPVVEVELRMMQRRLVFGVPDAEAGSWSPAPRPGIPRSLRRPS